MQNTRYVLFLIESKINAIPDRVCAVGIFLPFFIYTLICVHMFLAARTPAFLALIFLLQRNGNTVPAYV